MRESMDQPSTADLAYGKDSQEAKTARTTDELRSTETSASANRGESETPLINVQRSQEYSTRWQDVQAEFVDEPQKAVKDADGLVAEVIQTLATTFADQRRQLEDQWKAGGDVSTEDLRQALMQYRSFFQRLLAA